MCREPGQTLHGRFQMIVSLPPDLEPGNHEGRPMAGSISLECTMTLCPKCQAAVLPAIERRAAQANLNAGEWHRKRSAERRAA